MPDSKKVLLVEGDSDKQLFSVICNILHINPTVYVAVPGDIGGPSNTKGGLLSLMPTLIKQIPDGKLVRLAVIVDADHPQNDGMGYRATEKKFADIVGSIGYYRKAKKGSRGGIFYSHDDGLSDIGLWIMPNNRDEGMLEDWIMRCIHESEHSLIELSTKTVRTLPVPRKFSDFHEPKAEISTWLAWQRIPGQGAHAACRAGLIDKNATPFLELADWLQKIFD